MKSLYQKVLNGLNFELTELNANVAVEQIEDCYGDENQLYQVFTNLVGNAIKYRDKNRILSIEINSSVQFNKVIYCVKDNGIGINSRNINKIWDVFFRANPTDLEAGEGLGLSLARKIVEKHTGKIWVESELGVGSTFFVELSKTEFSEI
jgi:signal transduction histidine kinase